MTEEHSRAVVPIITKPNDSVPVKEAGAAESERKKIVHHSPQEHLSFTPLEEPSQFPEGLDETEEGQWPAT